jgi:hypothetical protein
MPVRRGDKIVWYNPRSVTFGPAYLSHEIAIHVTMRGAVLLQGQVLLQPEDEGTTWAKHEHRGALEVAMALR